MDIVVVVDVVVVVEMVVEIGSEVKHKLKHLIFVVVGLFEREMLIKINNSIHSFLEISRGLTQGLCSRIVIKCCSNFGMWRFSTSS